MCVKLHANTTRVFTFGIGADRNLIEGLARAGNGDYEIIGEGESTDTKVMKQLCRALKPALTNVTVSWDYLEVKTAPSRVPPVFMGERLVLYAFLKENRRGKRRE